MAVLDLPDITSDLARLGTDPPSKQPSQPPSPSPTPPPTRQTKRPTRNPTAEPSPSPTTPAPSPNPTTPEPISNPVTTPAPTVVSSFLPIPVETPAPVVVTPAPSVTPAPTYAPTYVPTLLPAPTPPVVRTYYSCPPPSSRTVEARDRNGSDVLITISPPISTVKINYDFQVQLLKKKENMDDLLPIIENRLGESLAEYMKSNTENGQDETRCGGYYVEDFRRNLKLRRTDLTQVPTKIIGISSAKDLSVEKDIYGDDEPCVPKNKHCYVVRGEYEATYVGFNEAGVKSSISRAVKEEMIEQGSGVGNGSSSSSSHHDHDHDEYELNFIGSQNEHVTTADTPSSISVMDILAEAVPSSDGHGPTPYGMGILAAFGAAFMVLVYIVFVKSDAPENLKDKMEERKQKKADKKRALGETDDEKQQDDQSYCYDLESVAVYGNSDNEGEAGVEVTSSRSGSSRDNSRDSGKTKKMSNTARARVSASAASRDSGKTKKMSNRADELNYTNVQKMGSLLEDDAYYYDEECYDHDAVSVGPKAVSPVDAGCSVRSPSSTGSGSSKSGRTKMISRSCSSNSSIEIQPMMVDRTPSLFTTSASSPRGTTTPKNNLDWSPTSANSTVIHQLQSISEADLPPPMNDTPHMSHRPVRNNNNRPHQEAATASPAYEEFEV